MHNHAGIDRAEGVRRRGVRAIQIALGITIVFIFVQVIGGWLAGSLALLADAAHMFTDAASYLLALFAFWVSKRPATARMSYGYYRSEILGALLGVLALWIICAFLIYEAIRRILSPPMVEGGVVFIIACITLGMNLVTMWVLNRSKKESLNIKAAYLHVLSDLLGNVGVIISGAIIYFTGWFIVDPILTILFTALILFSSLRMIKESTEILMEATPRSINPADVIQALLLLPTIEDVHDLHIWTVTSGRYALSAHLIGRDSDTLLHQAHTVLKETFGIDHMTLQVEHPEKFNSEYCADCSPTDT